MNKIFPYFAVTVLALTGCCIIYAQDSGSAKQTNTAKTDIGYSESQPYMPRVFETSNKSKKQKNKKNAPQESAQVTPSVAEKLSADTVITLPVSIFDSRGGFITGLQKSDFKVFVNDVECSVAAVETRNQPLNIILLIDTSPSAYLQINDLQSYALAIVDQLRPQDKAMVLQFNIDMKIMTELTNDHEVLAKGIKKTQGGDGTSLYDTIQEVFSGELKAVMGRKALIILTDGVDTTSRKVS
jgi:Mg-chelatase subunit ChlD